MVTGTGLWRITFSDTDPAISFDKLVRPLPPMTTRLAPTLRAISGIRVAGKPLTTIIPAFASNTLLGKYLAGVCRHARRAKRSVIEMIGPPVAQQAAAPRSK